MSERCPLCDTYPPGTLCHKHTWNGELRLDVHPAVLEAREHLVDEERYRLARTDSHDQQLELAVFLALDLKTCAALLRGEAVPLSRLDSVYVRKYGIRDAA